VKLEVVSLGGCLGCLSTLLELGESTFSILGQNQVLYMPFLVDKKEIAPCDVALVEGGVRDHRQLETAASLRESASRVIALGSCAVYGGVPGLANQVSEEGLFRRSYEDHVFQGLPEGLGRLLPLDSCIDVDLKMPGCPPPRALVEWVLLRLSGKGEGMPSPLPEEEITVCSECRLQCTGEEAGGLKSLLRDQPRPGVCLLEQGYVCLGPVTKGGCGAPCPGRHGVPCAGCRGPSLQVLLEPSHDLALDTLRRLSRAAKVPRGELETALPDVPHTFYAHCFAEPLMRRKRRGGTSRFFRRLGETVRR
jgi:F420-non-reducing hydrogenase small subunit